MAPQKAQKPPPKPPPKLRPLLPKPPTTAQLEADGIPWSEEPRLPPTLQQRDVVMDTPASFEDFNSQYNSGQNPYHPGGPTEPGTTLTNTPTSPRYYGAPLAAPRVSLPLNWDQQPGPLRAPAGPSLGFNFSAGPEPMTMPTSASSTAASEANFQPTVSWENLDAPEVLPINPGTEETSGADEQQDLLDMWTNGSLELPAGVCGDPNAELTLERHDLSKNSRAAEFRKTEEIRMYRTSEQICDQLFLAPINEFEEEYMGLKKVVTGHKRKIDEISDWVTSQSFFW